MVNLEFDLEDFSINKIGLGKNNRTYVVSTNKKKYLANFDLVIHAAWSDLENYNSTNHMKKILPENIKFLRRLIYFMNMY